jgi:hypothetical protein
MKSFLLLTLFSFISFFSIHAQEDGIVKYFSNQINDSNFNHAYISPRMISAVIKMDISELDEEMKSIIKDLKGMRILSSQKDGKKHFDDFVKILDTKGYETIVSTRKPAESVRIYLKNEDKPDGEILMVFFSNDACSMTAINGKVNLDRIAKLSRQLNIKGAEYLQNMKRE